MVDADSIDVDLEPGTVPETMLLPLWSRGFRSRCRHPFLADALAAEAVHRINFDFAGKFGKPTMAGPVRARWSDQLIMRFIAAHPNALVIALGEGLESQFWRVDNGQIRWVSVDLPRAIDLRRRVLPMHERNLLIEASVLDPECLASVHEEGPVFITAAGLFIYLEKPDVEDLLRRLAVRFPGGELFFDTIPTWLSRRSLSGIRLKESYTLPPLPFGLDLKDLDPFAAGVPGLRVLSAVTYGEAFPRAMPISAFLSRIGRYRDRLCSGLIHARFDPSSPSETPVNCLRRHAAASSGGVG